VGSAIGGIVVFIVAVWGYLVYSIKSGGDLPGVSVSSGPRQSREVVTAPPEIKERFLGTQGSYTGGFSHDRDRVLATGPGKISGKVSSSGKPVQGLRLRLALNDSVMSEWAETDAAGQYSVSVPFGKYRIDGYQLDYKTANAVLSGKTDVPRNGPPGSDDIMTVTEGNSGRGLDLEYVDPVRKKGPAGEVSLTKPVILEWEAYPGAAEYEIQLTEARDANDYASWQQLFKCCNLPRAKGTSFDVSKRGVTLKKAHVYYVEITALDARGQRLAGSANRHTPDFSTTD
jgi:hypothetical protein